MVKRRERNPANWKYAPGAFAGREHCEDEFVVVKQRLKVCKSQFAKCVKIRKKQATAFKKESRDLKTNLGGLAKALRLLRIAIEKRMEGFSAFLILQTSAASVIRELSITMDMSSVDREMLTSFLSMKSGCSSASGKIVGILKTMEDELKASLKDAEYWEAAAIAEFEGFVEAKTKEIQALTESIETKTARVDETSRALKVLKSKQRRLKYQKSEACQRKKERKQKKHDILNVKVMKFSECQSDGIPDPPEVKSWSWNDESSKQCSAMYKK